MNFVPIPFCFGHLRLTNPWHVAMYLNARLPILNHFPLAIDKEEMGYLDCNNYFTTKESGRFCYLTFSSMISILQSLQTSAGLLHNTQLYVGSVHPEIFCSGGNRPLPSMGI